MNSHTLIYIPSNSAITKKKNHSIYVPVTQKQSSLNSFLSKPTFYNTNFPSSHLICNIVSLYMHYCPSRTQRSLDTSLLTVPRFSLKTFGKRSFSVFGLSGTRYHYPSEKHSVLQLFKRNLRLIFFIFTFAVVQVSVSFCMYSAVLSVLHACVLYFCICHCSAQLSMFHMERRLRNTLIIIILLDSIMC